MDSHKKSRWRRVPIGLAVAGCLAATVALAACGDDDSGGTTATVPQATPTTASATTASSPSATAKPTDVVSANGITVEGFEMGYKVSGDLRPGTATITFKNTGTDVHMMETARLNDGVTLDQVKEAMSSNDDAAIEPLLADGLRGVYGTPALLSPGQSTTVTAVNLKAGTYAILCFVPSESGAPHVAMGMLNEFTVKGDPLTATPKSDGTIEITDSGYKLPSGFDGHGTFKVTDSGQDPHSISIAKLDAGTSVMDYFQYVNDRFQQGQPLKGGPGELVAGVNALLPGQTAYLTLDLPPGHYGYVSTEGGDGPDSPPDATKGLLGEFDVS